MARQHISWWNIEIGEAEQAAVREAIESKNISQGPVTRSFEKRVSEYLGVQHVIAVSNGSAAILSSLIANGIGVGDEVLLPDRTWIATAHAVHLLGARCVFVDVERERPVIDVELLKKCITSKSKAIIAVHLNGRSANMATINNIGQERGLVVIEDAAQALGSRNSTGFLGTQSEIGCFSLSMAKIVASGQGGLVVTNSDALNLRLRNIRTHGVENIKDVTTWGTMGFNFRLADIQAAIASVQLSKIEKKIKRCKEIYKMYREGLTGLEGLQLIPVDIESGEVPIYNEWRCDRRDTLSQYLEQNGVETRPFYPSMHQARYFPDQSGLFPNSTRFSKEGLYLPSGPDQSLSSVEQVVRLIQDGAAQAKW